MPLVETAGVISPVLPEFLLVEANEFPGDLKTGEGFIGSINLLTWKTVKVSGAGFFPLNKPPIFSLSPPKGIGHSQ